MLAHIDMNDESRQRRAIRTRRGIAGRVAASLRWMRASVCVTNAITFAAAQGFLFALQKITYARVNSGARLGKAQAVVEQEINQDTSSHVRHVQHIRTADQGRKLECSEIGKSGAAHK